MTLHLIAEDLERHAWYERLFVRTIADAEEYAATWAAFEELVASGAIAAEPGRGADE